MVSQGKKQRAIEAKIVKGKATDERRWQKEKEKIKLQKKEQRKKFLNNVFRIEKPVLGLLYIILILTAIFFILLQSPITSAYIDGGALSTDMYEIDATSIKVNWNWGNTSIYVDGINKTNNFSMGYCVLTNLNPFEKHRIDIIDIDNSTQYYLETKTDHSEYYFIFIALIGIVFILLTERFIPFMVFGLLIGLYIIILGNIEGQDAFFLLLGGIIIIFSMLYPTYLYRFGD